MEQVFSWVNGLAANTVSLHNRGLAYGDGVFETVLCRGQEFEHLGLHLKRLRLGCERLGLDVPELDSVLESARAAISSPYSVLKIIVTRAEAAASYGYISSAADVVVSLRPYAPSADVELKMGLGTITLAENALLAGIKHLSRIEQVAAAAEAKAQGLDDLLMLDHSGNIIEAIHSNVFFHIAGQWCTPELDKAGVAGVMREYLLRGYFPANNINCKVKALRLSDLDACDAIVCAVFGRLQNY